MRIKRKAEWSAGVLVMMLALSLAISACGGNDSNSGDEGASGQPAAVAGNGNADQIDACGIVTIEDATKMFGQPASQDQGAAVLDANLLGECLWSYTTESGSQLIQFYVWNGPQYYSAPADSTPYTLGDESYLRVNQYTGVDIEWLQSGKTISLSYSTSGSGVPDAETKVEELKALAQQTAGKL